jgi:hypothetical protein
MTNINLISEDINLTSWDQGLHSHHRFTPLLPSCSYKILLWFYRNFSSFLSALQPPQLSPWCTTTPLQDSPTLLPTPMGSGAIPCYLLFFGMCPSHFE